MTCLICSAELKNIPTFQQLFTLAPSNTRTCSACSAIFEKIAGHHCPHCCKSGEHDVCSDCLYWQSKGKLVNHQAIYRYNASMKDYFSRYKFQGDYLLRKVFQSELKSALKSYRDYLFVPIPLSNQRLQERGFNQVTGLLDGLGLPYQELLTKRETKKQSDKSRSERLQSQNPFELSYNKALPDKILLIDDIYTTGMTLQLAAQHFYEKGVKEIKTFSLAR